jgi:uncharacterized Ntn-hydrolase superfamily protein
MTLSVVARCADSGMLGVAAVTGTPGVGKLLTWAQAGVGAVATQGWINPYLGIDAVALMGNGHPADRALQAVVSLDDDADLRQVGAVDGHGVVAAHTGDRCSGWAGHRTGPGFTVQGNLLEGPGAVDAAADTVEASVGTPLVERLSDALQAAVDAGGDRRGHHSATVLVVDTEQYPLWDVRVDEHPEPLAELRRLIARFEETLLPQIRKLPTRRNIRGQLSSDTEQGLV